MITGDTNTHANVQTHAVIDVTNNIQHTYTIYINVLRIRIQTRIY